MIETWLFILGVAVCGVWAISVFDRQHRRAARAMTQANEALKKAAEESQRLDTLECAVEDYVQLRRTGGKAECRTKPASRSR